MTTRSERIRWTGTWWWVALALAAPVAAAAEGGSRARGQEQEARAGEREGSGATSRARAPAPGQLLDVEELNDDLDRYAGQKVTVVGEVQERVDARSFVLESGGLFDDEILVAIPKDAKGIEAGRITDDAKVVVSGTLHRFSIVEIERELGWDLNPELEVEVEDTKAVLVADRIQPADRRQARTEPQQGGSGEAQPDRAGTGSQQREASKSVVGTVQSLGEDTLSLKNELGETHEFALGEGTRFVRDGQEIGRDQVGEGDRVRAAFTGEPGGDLQATEILLMSSGSGETQRSGGDRPGGASRDAGDPREGASRQQR